jgi:hypothetical protein
MLVLLTLYQVRRGQLMMRSFELLINYQLIKYQSLGTNARELHLPFKC